jgi:hypothetical protein
MRTFLVLGLLLTAAAAHAQGGPTRPAPPAPPAPPTRPYVTWQRFISEDGQFSVSMPGLPKFKTEMLRAKNGHPVQYSSYTVDLGDRAYMASYSDYDRETAISLDGAVEGALRSWQRPVILSRRQLTLYGYPAQIVDFESDEYRVVLRAFASAKRLYQLGFVGMRNDFPREDANEFLNSFRLR